MPRSAISRRGIARLTGKRRKLPLHSFCTDRQPNGNRKQDVCLEKLPRLPKLPPVRARDAVFVRPCFSHTRKQVATSATVATTALYAPFAVAVWLPRLPKISNITFAVGMNS